MNKYFTYSVGSLMAIATLLSDIFMSRIIGNSLLLSCLIIGFILFAVFLASYAKLNWRNTVKYLSSLGFGFVYLFSRTSANVIEGQIFTKPVKEFSSLFSLGYSLSQFFVGYFIAKWGNRFIGIVNFIASLLTIGTTLINPHPQYLLIIRFFTGVFFAAGTISFTVNTSEATKEKQGFFNILFFIGLFIMLKLASTVAFVVENRSIHWKIIMLCTGVAGILFSTILFFSKSEKDNSQSMPLFEGFKRFFKNSKLLSLAAFGFFVIAPTYSAQIAALASIDNALKQTGMTARLVNDFTAYGTLLMPFLGRFGVRNTVLFTSSISVISMIILSICYKFISLPIMVAIAIMFGISYAGHSISSTYISENFTMKEAANFFAIMNGIIMFGATVSQQVSSVLIGNINHIILFLLCCTIVSFTSGIFFFFQTKKKVTKF